MPLLCEGPHVRCPVCHQPMPATWSDGRKRRFCYPCTSAVLDEFVVRHFVAEAAQHRRGAGPGPCPGPERHERLDRLLEIDALGQLEPCETPPRQPSRRQERRDALRAERRDAILTYLGEHPKGRTLTEIKKALRLRYDVIQTLVAELEAETAVIMHPGHMVGRSPRAKVYLLND